MSGNIRQAQRPAWLSIVALIAISSPVAVSLFRGLALSTHIFDGLTLLSLAPLVFGLHILSRSTPHQKRSDIKEVIDGP